MRVNRSHIIAAFVLCLSLLATGRAQAQQIAIKANALAWAAMTPDIGFELVTSEHTSVGLSVFGNWKPYGAEWKMYVIQPEFRWWFNGRPLTRAFVGATIFGTGYDVRLADTYYKGNAIEAGVTFGYVFNLGKRWGFELAAGTGIMAFRQNQYDIYDDHNENNSDVNNWGYKLFPAKLSATFIYIIK